MTTELAKNKTAEMAPTREIYYLKPYYEVTPAENHYTVKVFMPGVATGAVGVIFENECLKITGERRWQPPKEWRALHREIRDEAYRLILQIGGEINAEKVAARMADGVLELTLPKNETAKRRTITVK